MLKGGIELNTKFSKTKYKWLKSIVHMFINVDLQGNTD